MLSASLRKWTVVGWVDAGSNNEFYELAKVRRAHQHAHRGVDAFFDVRRVAGTLDNQLKGMHNLRLMAKLPRWLGRSALALGVGTAVCGCLGQPVAAFLLGSMAVMSGVGCAVTVLDARAARKTLEERQPHVDYSRHMDTQFPRWSGIRTYHIEPQQEDKPLAQVWDAKPPSGAALGKNWAERLAAYPGRRTAFMLSGHARAGGSIASIPFKEVTRALHLTRERSGRPFDLGILDGCLAANFETLLPMAGAVRYLVASEEIEWTSTFDLAGLFYDMSWQKSPLRVAHSAADDTRSRAQQATMAVFGVHRLPALRDAVERMSRVTRERLHLGNNWQQVRRAFYEAVGMRTDTQTKNGTDRLIDMGSLLNRLASCGDAPIAEAARHAQDCYRRVVVKTCNAPDYQDETGMSIQGPHRYFKYKAYAKSSGLPEYSALLRSIRHAMRPWPSRWLHAMCGER
jgi:hypothetical protein